MTAPTEHRRLPLKVSLRARLTWAFAAAMAAVLIGLGTLVYLRLGSALNAGVDLSLATRADALTAALSGDGSAPLGGGHRFVDPDEAFAQVLDLNGTIVDSTPAIASRPLMSPAQVSATRAPTYLTVPIGDPEDEARLFAVPMKVHDQPAIVVVGETLGDRHDALRQLLTVYAIAGPAGLLLACLSGWLLAGAALRPVEALRRRAARISHIEPQARLPVPGTRDELARLAETLNDLLTRVARARDREHRFVDDASHELRTPLAVLKAELDLALSRPRTAEELEATLHAAATETDQLIALAEDLLVLARLRDGHQPLHMRPAYLPELLERAVAPLRALAGDLRPIRIDAPPVAVDVDAERVRRAVANLVDNGLRHGSGPVTVTAWPENRHVLIDVMDDGPGIPEPLLEAVFEPFFRASGRSAPLGTGPDTCSGLGLTIVKAIAESHHGSVHAVNRPEGGGHVRLTLGVGVGPSGV
jgi:two-component system, OmpR family, sensor kinase